MSEGKGRVVRGQNFSNGEKEIILGLVEQFGAELEAKRTDSLSCREREDAWMRLADQFNSVPGVTRRTAAQLKLWWSNQKKRSKKRQADLKVEIHRTGGGPAVLKTDDWDDRVATVSATSFQPLDNDFDSDAAYQSLCQSLFVTPRSAADQSSIQTAVPALFTTAAASTLQTVEVSATSFQLLDNDFDSDAACQSLFVTPRSAADQFSIQSAVPALLTTVAASTSQTVDVSVLSTVPVTATPSHLPSTTTKTATVEERSALKSARNWASRRRPRLQQETSVTARSAAIKASEQIEELSQAKLELIKLRLQVETQQKAQAAEKHELMMKMAKEEHELKVKVMQEEHKMKMLVLKAEAEHYKADTNEQ